MQCWLDCDGAACHRSQRWNSHRCRGRRLRKRNRRQYGAGLVVPEFTGRRVGNEVEIVDPDGKVVATTGQRYEITLAFPPAGPPYVVCGFDDKVKPL